MQKTAILFASLLLAIFVAGSVSALYVCDPSQTMLKLGAHENAHVELHNESLYSLRLCYSDIYGLNYTNPNPHTCTSSNTVAKLAQATNSHIEGPSGSAFSNLACYGDLVCTLRTNCFSNEAIVLTLAQTTNSHASFNNTLPIKLCCSSAFALMNANSTNSTFGSVLGFIVNSPVHGATYNDFVIVDITAGTATSLNYSIDSASAVNYAGATSITLPAGSHTIIVMASNGTDFAQRTIVFGIVNTTSTGNSGGSGGGGGGSDDGNGVRSGFTEVSQGSPGDEAIIGGEQPLELGEGQSRRILSSLTLWQILGSAFFFLILLLLLLMLLIHRRKRKRNQPNSFR